MLLIQHAYNSQQNVLRHELQQKESELRCSHQEITELRTKPAEMEHDKGTSEEQMAVLEMELSQRVTECEMLRNSSFDKDNVIDHLKDTIIRSLTANRQTINVSGRLAMSDKTNVVTANQSNVMIGSDHSTQTLDQSGNINELFSEIMRVAQASNQVSKEEFIKISAAIDEIKYQLATENPDKADIERNLSNLGSIASIASLVGQLSPMLLGLF